MVVLRCMLDYQGGDADASSGLLYSLCVERCAWKCGFGTSLLEKRLSHRHDALSRMFDRGAFLCTLRVRLQCLGALHVAFLVRLELFHIYTADHERETCFRPMTEGETNVWATDCVFMEVHLDLKRVSLGIRRWRADGPKSTASSF